MVEGVREKTFWIGVGLFCLAFALLVFELLAYRSKQSELSQLHFLLMDKVTHYWSCSPGDVEREFENYLKYLRDSLTQVEKLILWADTSEKNRAFVEGNEGIVFMRRVRQLESRIKTNFPDEELPKNLGFPNQMPAASLLPYLNYHLKVLSRILPVVLSSGGKVENIVPILDEEKGFVLKVVLVGDLKVLLSLLKEIGSPPVLLVRTGEVKAIEGEEERTLRISFSFAPVFKRDVIGER